MQLELFLMLSSAVMVKAIPSCQSELAACTNTSGAYAPKCEEDGSYSSMQCHDSTGLCWCAKLDGTKINAPSKDKYKACECVRKADTTRTKKLIGGYVPQCQDNGHYTRKQCRGSTGSCWCASEETGEKITELTADAEAC